MREKIIDLSRVSRKVIRTCQALAAGDPIEVVAEREEVTPKAIYQRRSRMEAIIGRPIGNRSHRGRPRRLAAA